MLGRLFLFFWTENLLKKTRMNASGKWPKNVISMLIPP